MVKGKVMTNRLRTRFKRAASVLLIMLASVILISPGFAYAAKDDSTGSQEPIREVHAVGVGNDAYCFFVTRNVVLTPAEVANMTDEELTAAVLKRAGLFMIETNCRKASHGVITLEDWNENRGSFLLSEPDIDGIRKAIPVNGRPVKFYMDLIVSEKITYEPVEDEPEDEAEPADETNPEDETKPADETNPEDGTKPADETKPEDGTNPEEQTKPEDQTKPDEQTEPEKEQDAEEEELLYSTYKRTGAALLFVVVATEEDAKVEEDRCKEDPPKPVKVPSVKSDAASDDEMLPEYRTITLVDRSGAPIEKTLKDGDPVTLEWREPGKTRSDDGSSFIDRIPGGIAGLAVLGAAAAAAVAAAVISARRRRTDE